MQKTRRVDMGVTKEFSRKFRHAWLSYRTGGSFSDFVISFREMLGSGGIARRNDLLSIAKNIVKTQLPTVTPTGTDVNIWAQRSFTLQRDYLKAARATLCDTSGSTEASLLLSAISPTEPTDAVLEEHELVGLSTTV